MKRLTVKHSVLCLILASVAFLAAGQSATITGRVLDAATNEPLPFSTVQITNSTIGTTTDLEGNFTITRVPFPAVYDLLITHVGYESFTQKISLSAEELTLRAVFLKTSSTVLGSVEVTAKRDKAWEKTYRKFTKVFLGEDTKGERCKILNPWVLEFTEAANGDYSAKADAALEVENRVLGYSLQYYLKEFAVSKGTYKITGKAFFKELEPETEKERERWKLERTMTYNRSLERLFRSMIEKRVRAEGFRLYQEIGDVTKKNTRDEYFSHALGTMVADQDTSELVVPGPQKGTYRIQFKGRMEVHYTAVREAPMVYRDVFHPVSWIELKRGFVLVSKDGFEMNTADVITSGDLSNMRISRLLPMDYRPEESASPQPVSDFSVLREDIYLHTDKPYYYPGETIWFKGYVRYLSPLLRDSLSTTVYVDLIGPDKKIRTTRMLQIDRGTFFNQFMLPDTSSVGSYYLRCYTNLNRNFGDDQLYVKPVPVLDLKELVDASAAESPASGEEIQIESKESFSTRERITLKIVPGDEEAVTLAGANLSMSVTDMRMVVPARVAPTIVDEVERRTSIQKGKFFQVEYGFGFDGIYYDNLHRTVETLLNVFQLSPKNYTMTNSDRNGRFTVSGLNFYDSAYFSIQPVTGRETWGSAELLPRQLPGLHLPVADIDLPIVKSEQIQRMVYARTSDDAIMLAGVEVKAAKIQEEYTMEYRVKRPFGRPDHVIYAKDLAAGYPDILSALPGKFPGLTVRTVLNPGEEPRIVVYLTRNANSSVNYPPEVTVTIDDNFVFGRPEQILSTIPLTMVETIELKKGVNVLYGNASNNGILSIYTRKGASELPSTVKSIVVKGYDRPLPFKSPDYSTDTNASNGDFRSTIYWNPNIQLDASGNAVVDFYSADNPGVYRIVVEGLTREGKPLRYVRLLNIIRK